MTNCTYLFRNACLSVFLVVGIYPAFSQQIEKSINVSNGDLLGFLEYKPAEYNQDTTTKYPIIIFLHGIGERGNGTTELKNVSRVGLPMVIRLGNKMKFTWNGKTETFLVLSPQCPSKYYMWPTILVDELVAYAKQNLRIDTNRIYLTGLSMGGGGTYKYISFKQQNAEKFAAAATICAPCTFTSGANVAKANLPLWSFHAADDSIAMASCTESAISRINAENPAVVPLKTIWPTGGHIVWDRVYTDTNYKFNGVVNIFEWFLAQNKTFAVNKLPVANAGPDLAVNPSVGIVALNASASQDPDGKLVRYVWKKLSGPAGPVITNPMDIRPVTSVSGLTTSGTYQYELSVVDDRAAYTKDTLNINVSSMAPLPGNDTTLKNIPPVALTFPDKKQWLVFSDRTQISGTPSTDTDGWIQSFRWVKLSGPAGAGAVENSDMGKTWAVNLVAGTYRYRVIVSDNKGALSYDDMIVIADSTGMAAKVAGVPASSKLEDELSYSTPGSLLKESLSVYPNPSSGQVRMTYASNSAGRSYISLYDVNGRMVKNLPFHKGEGIYQGDINLDGLPSGLYYIEVVTGNARNRTSLIKK